ncbi:KRRI-Interacting protein 1, partial [Ascosphaera acerosa]
MATLAAIRNKDPRVYDANAQFYRSLDEEGNDTKEERKEKEKQKSMTLRDYHRENLMRAAETGKLALDEEEEEEEHTTPHVKTFDEEQEELKREVIREMHADKEGEDTEDDDGFLIPKPTSTSTTSDLSPRPVVTETDVANADKDPETFLSNFMAARAWLPPASGAGAGSSATSRFAPLESDDEEEMARAERFEEAFNLRFEDPDKANETLTTHDRELVRKYSVRREEPSSRKKRREAEKARKEEEARARAAERARLRKLKIEQIEEKVDKIRKAAGIRARQGAVEDVLEEDWIKLIDDDFTDEQFEEMMRRRFGEEYYAEREEQI